MSQVRNWRFWLPLALQIGILACIPAQGLYTQLTGRTVKLQTVPVDPYSWLTGYSQTLRYDISRVATLEKLAKQPRNIWKEKTDIYVILQETGPNSPWKAIDATDTKPQGLSPQRIALKGRVQKSGNVIYGLETYYMPESRRVEVNRTIFEAQRTDKRAIVELKIDANGHGSPVAIEVGDQQFRF
jgi:uncharacterized membrane-anchored protein